MLFCSWEDVVFSSNVNGAASVFRLDALDAPAFSGSVLELNRVGFTVPSGGVSDAILVVENVKNVRLAMLDIQDNSAGSGTGIRIGQDESVVPNTLQDGGVGRLSIDNLFGAASVDLRHCFGIRLSEANVTNGGKIFSATSSRPARSVIAMCLMTLSVNVPSGKRTTLM